MGGADMVKSTVVIPNYNGIRYIEDCLDSLYAGTQTQFEVIMVDNASTDGSRELVQEKFPQVKLICNETNTGFSEAVNQGIQASTTPYVILLNNDTRADKAFIHELEKAIEKDVRIFSDFINILLSCTGISHQKDMLDIISFFSNIAQRKTYALTHEYLQNNINSKEYCNHTSGEVRQLHRIEKHHDGKKPHGIGFDNIKNLILGLRRSLGCIHVKDIIQDQIPRYYNKQYREVNLPC